MGQIQRIAFDSDMSFDMVIEIIYIGMAMYVCPQFNAAINASVTARSSK